MKTVFQGKKFTIKQGEKSGEETEIAERMPSIGVIPFTSEGKIILLKEHRKEHGKTVIGIIAGGASSLALKKEAARELAEEAKLKAEKLTLYYIGKPAASIKHAWQVFIATGLSKTAGQHDADEQMEPFECTLEEACKHALNDNFRNETQSYVLLKLRHDLQTGKFKLP